MEKSREKRFLSSPDVFPGLKVNPAPVKWCFQLLVYKWVPLFSRPGSLGNVVLSKEFQTLVNSQEQPEALIYLIPAISTGHGMTTH